MEQFLSEFLAWKEAAGQELDFHVDEEGVYWLMVGEDVQRLNVSLVPFNDPHDDQAIVVEAPLGAWAPELDTRGLLLFAGAEMFVSRFSLVPVGTEDILVVEAAMPFASLSFPVFDRMIREVASVAMHVLGITAVES